MRPARKKEEALLLNKIKQSNTFKRSTMYYAYTQSGKYKLLG